MAIQTLIQRFDGAYPVGASVGVQSGGHTDFRQICNNVSEFQTFFTQIGQEIRQEGLTTYELDNKVSKRCKKNGANWEWEIIPTTAEVLKMIQDEIAKIPPGSGGEGHTHSNKTELDKIAAGDKEKWDGYQSQLEQMKTDTYTKTEVDKKISDIILESGNITFRDILPNEIFEIEITPPVTIPVTGVSLNKSTSTLTVGNTEQLTATISPSNATNKTLTWNSSDTNKATVSSTGLVTAVSEGNTIITVTTQDGNKTATCNVTISNASSIPTVVQSGLILHYNAIGGSGTVINDLSGNNNDGVFKSMDSSAWQSDGSVKGNGSGHIESTNNIGVSNSLPRTIQFKFKQDGSNIITGHGNATNSLSVLPYGDNYILYDENDTSSSYIPFPTTPGVITDIAITYDGTKYEMYSNGVKLSGSCTNLSKTVSDSKLFIFAGGGSMFNNSNHNIYYIAVYDRVLTSGEIQNNYDNNK